MKNKKLLMFVPAMAASALLFSACNSAKEEPAADEAAEAVEEAAEAVEEAADEEASEPGE